MSDRIDQRIVEMSFENHKFEEGINKSKNSLKSFADALKNMGDGKDFSGLDNSIQSVSSSFSMLEQIGIGALRRIGEAAVNAGASLIKSLTIDQVSAGIDKYRQKIEAVQTMVAAGYDLEEVEKSMNNLMWFSDETSYSFADMAGNMAKFISAGVDLKTSERAMQGIATWAAHSGKDATAASIAMFNLSQAISIGYVDTMNWRSIMNQNMNTTMFKQVAIDVAEATGAIKEGQVTVQNFDANLKTKWFTNDVLTKTLEQYSLYAEKVKEVQDEMGFDTAMQAMRYIDARPEQFSDVINTIGKEALKAAQVSKSFKDSILATMDAVSTGWMKTYELVFGQLPEAIEKFSSLTEILWTVFASTAANRNEMLLLIKNAGGIKSLFQSLKNVSVAFLTPLKAISQAFDQFFPPRTATQWLSIISTLETITKKMIMTEETANKIQRTFAGFFAVLDLGWETAKFLGSALYEIVGIFVPLGDSLLNTTASIGDFLVEMNRLIKQSGVFQYGLLGVKVAAVLVKGLIGEITSRISNFVRVLWTTDKPLEFLGKTVLNVFSGTLGVIKNIVSWISGKFMGAMNIVQSAFSKQFNIDSESVLGGILTILKDFIVFISGEASDGINTFGDSIKNLNFSRIATFVTGGILLSFINQLSNLTRSMANVLTSTNTFVTKFSKKLFGTTTKIKDLAYVIGILSASLYVLSKIPWEEMKVGLKGMAGALGLFVAAYASIQAITVISSKAMNGMDVVKSTFGLTQLAAGLAIMAIALNKISGIAKEDVWRAVGVMGAMMGLLTAYQALSALISTIPGQHAVSINFAGMTLGVLGLVGIVALLSIIPVESFKSGIKKLAAGLLALVAIQAMFAWASKLSGGHTLSTKLISIAAGLIGLIAVLKLLSLVSSSEISKGIGNILLLGGVLAALQLMFNIAGRIGGGVRAKTNIFAMQMGLVSMIALVAILGKFEDQTKIQNGIKTLNKMAGIIIALEILTAVAARIGGGNKLQRILGSVSLTMLSFTALISIIGWYKQETIDKGLLTITKMLGIIIAFEVLTSMAGNLSGGVGAFTSMIGMVTALLAVTASLVLLSMIDQEALRKSATSIAIAVLAIGLMATGIGVMAKSLSILSTSLGGMTGLAAKLLPGFVGLGIVILSAIAFLTIVKSISSIMEDMSWSSIGKFIVGMGAITSLVVAFTLLAKVPGIVSGTAGIAALVPGFAGMGVAVLAAWGLFSILAEIAPKIDTISTGSILKFIGGLGLIAIMAVGMSLLSVPLAALGAAALPALGGVVVAIIGVGLIIGAFVGLASLMEALFQKDPDFLIKGIDKLILVGEGIGRFIGSIVGGFNAELLVNYGKGLAGFSDAMKGVDSKSFDGVASLAKALLTLTGTAMLDGLAKFVNSGKNTGQVFGQQLNGLIKAFKGISVEDATKASVVITALAPMTNSLKKLAEASGSIPNTGGLLGGLLGNNDVDVFGDKLKNFIMNLNAIDVLNAQHASDVLGAMAPMASNLKSFAKAADKIPNGGGFLSVFMGGNDINTFGIMLVDFVGIFKGLDPTADVGKASDSMKAMEPMMSNLKSFAEMADTIPESGGLVTWFTGDNEIKDFVNGISKLVKELGTLDSTKVSNASNNVLMMTTNMLPGLERFATLANNLTASGGWAQVFTGEKSLIHFAKGLKSFVKELKGVDVSVISPALKSLKDITTSFKAVGGEAIGSAIDSFNKNRVPFQAGIAKLLTDTIAIVDAKKKPIETSFTGIFVNALTESRKYIGQFRVLGGDIVKGLKTGIDANSGVASKAIVKMSSNVIERANGSFQVQSPSKVFQDIGGWLGLGLAKGIEDNAGTAVLASINMAEGVEEGVRDSLGVHSFSDDFIGISKDLVGSLAFGLDKFKGNVINKAGELGFDITDMSIKGMADGLTKGEGGFTAITGGLLDLLTGETTISELTGAGNKAGGAFTNGVANSIGGTGGSGRGSSSVKKSAEDLANDAYQAFKTQMDYLMEYELISTDMELAKWREFAAMQKEGSLSQLKAKKQVAELSFEFSKTWIDKEKYYKKLSLDEELAAWIRVQQKKEITNAQRLQADREVFRIQNELQQNAYQNGIDWIEEEKFYNRLTKNQELKKMKELQNIFEENSDDRKKVNRQIFSLEKEIAETNIAYAEQRKQIEKDAADQRIQLEEDYYAKTKEVQDKLKSDIKSLTDEYDNAVKSRMQSLYSAWGLFDKVEIGTVDGTELLKNLEDQVVAFDQWQAQIAQLAEKGVSEGLVNELRDMGPQSLAQIAALNKLSGPELDKYVALWDRKHVEAKDQAIYELQDMNSNTQLQIRQLTKDAESELDYYEKVWKDSLRHVNKDTDKQLDALERNWKESIGDMTDGGLSMVQGFRANWNGELAGMVSDTQYQVNKLKELTGNVGAMGSTLTDLVKPPRPDVSGYTKAANDAGNGWLAGLIDKYPESAAAAGGLGLASLHGLNNAMAIKSPSKKTLQAGKYFVEGLVQGIKRFSGLASDASASVGLTALAALSASITDTPDLLGASANEFSITPILDLTNVRAGMNDINSLLGSTASLGLGASVDLLPMDNAINQNGIMRELMNNLLAAKDQEIDLTGTLTVQVVNDKGEIVDIAETAIKDILRRESR